MHYLGLIFLSLCLILTASTGVQARSQHSSQNQVVSQKKIKKQVEKKSDRHKHKVAEKNTRKKCYESEKRNAKKHQVTEKSDRKSRRNKARVEAQNRHRHHERAEVKHRNRHHDRDLVEDKQRHRGRDSAEIKLRHKRQHRDRLTADRSSYINHRRSANYENARRLRHSFHRRFEFSADRSSIRNLRKRNAHASRLHAFYQRKSESARNRRISWEEHAKASQLKTYGKASWYGSDFHGGPTASGIKYDMYTFTAAHRTLPMGTVVKVTTQDSGKSVMVCVTDRGPYVRGRIIDLSYAAATQLGLRAKGVGDVKLEVVTDSRGTPLKPKQAFYVQYSAARGKLKAGPYKDFSDATAMHEALRQAHPEAKVILE